MIVVLFFLMDIGCRYRFGLFLLCLLSDLICKLISCLNKKLFFIDKGEYESLVNSF